MVTIVHTNFALIERLTALQFAEALELAKVHDLVRDILDARSKQLHIATSDVEHIVKKEALTNATILDSLLIEALILLPDNVPEFQIVIKHPLTGAELWYQRHDGTRPVYVSFDQWKPEEMVGQIIDRRERLLAERSRSAQALDEIHTFEVMGISAVTEKVKEANVLPDEVEAEIA